ncbi:hypothetical protein CTA1_11069 [Colletotrichum tanaceti]|uniref:Uncharacterized protein n=1 Tax=Colletotrichum tanaceti TaxID=1306861 RepID=A0A4U6XLD3_9PEZI|nr:hypothetical protein CTA1_11069 [Colletotrichum tanaceti]
MVAEVAHSAEGDSLGVTSSGSISQHHSSAMDADAASSSSALQASSLSSIVCSLEYAHSHHEPQWPYESHQNENLYYGWDISNTLGEEDPSSSFFVEPVLNQDHTAPNFGPGMNKAWQFHPRIVIARMGSMLTRTWYTTALSPNSEGQEWSCQATQQYFRHPKNTRIAVR